MSLSLAVKGPHDSVDLSGQDILLAAVLHALVLIAIVAITLWKPHPLPLPPKAFEVKLISADMFKKAKPRQTLARKKLKAPAKPKVKTLPKNYDPFAPLVSTTKAPAKPTAKASPDMKADLRGQLSEKEMDRYIAMIQAAVQKNWKVSADLKAEEDPVVSMELNPNGSVRKLEIVVSSGSPAMDESLIRAIQAAAPFTLPRQQFEVFRTNRMRFHPLR